MIEPMREDDVAAVLAIDPDVRAGQLREELTRAWGRLRVDREHGVVRGYVLFWHVTDEIHLLNVAVAETARRQGRGRALVEEVIGYGRAHAAAKVLLEVRRSNEGALALYRGLGFEEINVRKRYYDDGEDAIEMMLAL